MACRGDGDSSAADGPQRTTQVRTQEQVGLVEDARGLGVGGG